jgi:hypothetical protein
MLWKLKMKTTFLGRPPPMVDNPKVLNRNISATIDRILSKFENLAYGTEQNIMEK